MDTMRTALAGEACLARRVRSTRITDVAIIHSKTSFVGYCGRGVPRHTAGVLLRRAMARRYNRNAI